MTNIVKRHNFDESLSKIKDFAHMLPAAPNLERYETDGGLFGLGNHYINGSEMNRFVETLQQTLIDSNNVMVKTISEFSEVYKTFDYLDKEYIGGIVSAVEAAGVASEQAKTAASKALHNEQDLREQFKALKLIVEKLGQTKRELSEKITAINSTLSQTKRELSQKVEAINSTLAEITEQQSKTEQDLSYKIENIRSTLGKVLHKINVASESYTQATKESSNAQEAYKEATQAASDANKGYIKATKESSKAQEAYNEATQAASDANKGYIKATQESSKAQEAYNEATQAASDANKSYTKATQESSKAQEAYSEAMQQFEQIKSTLEKRLWIAYGVAGVSLIVSIISLCIR